MKAFVSVLTVGLLAVVGTIASVPSAQANANPGAVITNYSGQSSCPTMSQFPVLVTNVSGTAAQTGSLTVSGKIANDVQVFSSQEAMTANGCRLAAPSSSAWSQNFTVQQGATQVLWLSVGGAAFSTDFGAQNLAVGGLPSRSSDQAWFDFWANLNGLSGQFQSLQVNYSGTGGTDFDTSHQNNFNVVQCKVNGSSVSPTTKILTPYSRGGASGPAYSQNEPVCLAWMPEGQFLDFSQGSSTQFTTSAVQLNSMEVDFAGTGNAEITSVVVNGVTANGTVAKSFDITQYNSPAVAPDAVSGNQYEGEFWVQDTNGAGAWVVANLSTAWLAFESVTTFQLVMNGQVVGSWTNGQ